MGEKVHTQSALKKGCAPHFISPAHDKAVCSSFKLREGHTPFLGLTRIAPGRKRMYEKVYQLKKKFLLANKFPHTINTPPGTIQVRLRGGYSPGAQVKEGAYLVVSFVCVCVL